MLVAATLALWCFWGCEKGPEPEQEPEPGSEVSYAITVLESDDCTVQVAESAVAGEEVNLTITVPDKGLRVTSVLYNLSECDRVSHDQEENVYVYSFVMPEEDVEISVNTSSSKFKISCESNELWQYSGAYEAIAGDEVTFKLIINNTYAIISVAYGDGEDEVCIQEGSAEIQNETATYTFSFTMPERDVTLVPKSDMPYYRVYRQKYDDGSKTILSVNHLRVDHSDPDANEYGNVPDPDDPYWPGSYIIESVKGDVVMFDVNFDLGYDSPDFHDGNPEGFITVTGLDSGAGCGVYWWEDKLTGVQSWAFTMPREDVLIEAHTTPLTTFEGEEFVGDYDGYYVHYGAQYASTVEETASADVDFSLGSNTVFALQSSESDRTPGYEYDIRGIYTYDENSSLVSYDPEGCKNIDGRDKDGYGISGTYDSEAWVVAVIDLDDGGLSENYRYYFSMKESAGMKNFIAASNSNGNRFLFQTETASGTSYWYYDATGTRTLYKVVADFSGKNINEEGAASKINSETGETYFRYSYSDGKPEFKMLGTEAGTYTGSEGNLVLDGFGEGTLNGKAGTYEIDETGMNLTFTYTGTSETVRLIIYKDTMTYSVNDSEDAVPPAGKFSSHECQGYINNNWIEDGVMELTIDPSAGTATFYLANADGSCVFHHEQNVKYVYDPAQRKLSISGFIVANPGTWSQANNPIEFIISEDGNEITCVNDRIQHPTKGPAYMFFTNYTVGGSWIVTLTKE